MSTGLRDYSAFKAYIRCSPDPFWQNFFEGLSRGEFPKGFYYDEHLRCLTYVTKKEKSSVAVDPPTDKPAVFRNFHQLQNFFRTKGISSPSDLGVAVDAGDTTPPPQADTWASIKAKATKKFLVYQFAQRLREIYNLPDSPEFLTEKILLMLSFQSIKPADIVIRRGRIAGINGVYVEGPDVSFPRVTKPRKSAPAKKEAPPALLQAIDKLIKDDRSRMFKV